MYRQILENIPDTIIVTDDQGNMVYVCPNTIKIFGLSQEQVYNQKNIQRLLNGTVCDIATLKIQQEIENIEWPITDSIGQEHFLLISMKLVSLNDGTVLYVMRDITDRKQTENPYRLSKSHFEELFNKSAIPLCFVNKEKSGLLFNKHFEKTFGYSPKEVSTLEDWWSLAYPDPEYRKWVLDTCYAELVHALETNTDISPIEYNVTCKNGDIRTMVVFGSFIRDDLLLTFFDVTERKYAEERLRESEEKYRTLFHVLPLGITISDPSGNILETNQIAERLTGVSKNAHEQRKIDGQERNIVRSDGTFMPPDEYASVKALAEKRTIENVEMGILKPDGDITWLNVTAAPIPLQNYGIAVTYNDITQHKQAKKELERNEERFRTVADFTYDWEYWVDPEGKMLYVSPSCERITGYSSQEFLNNPEFLLHIIHPYDRTRIANHHESLESHLVVCSFDFRIITQQGQERWIGHICQSVFSSDGRWLGRRASNRDITERKQAEDKLKASLAEKEVLLRELYHRTKNTLQVIRSMLLLQAATTPENNQVQKLVNDTENRIMAMALVHQKLYQSQDLSRISMQEYIHELADLIMQSSTVIAQNVSLKINVEPLSLLLDTAIPCGLILNELLSNALKYAFPDNRQGEISIRLFRNISENLELWLTDNGMGVPPGFDFRGQNTLGLQIVFEIAEQQMQGRVRFASERGVRCTIEFPDTLYTERV